jgi:hypothetical protein
VDEVDYHYEEGKNILNLCMKIKSERP